MKIGVSSYSFGKYIQTTKCSLLEVCSKAREIGFSGIEFIDIMPSKENQDIIKLAEDIKKHCDKIGLEIIAYTIGADFMADDIEAEKIRIKKCVDVCDALGAPLMRHDVCYSLPKNHLYSYLDAIKYMAPHIKEITEYAASKNIRTCTENHGYIFQSPNRVEELILAVSHQNYGWLCDIGNFLCADEDPIKSVCVAAPYTFHVHAKDFLFKSGNTRMIPDGFFPTAGQNYLRGTVLGHGVVPIKQCLEILRNTGYNGWVSLEFEGMEDCLPAIQSGFSFLEKYCLK